MQTNITRPQNKRLGRPPSQARSRRLLSKGVCAIMTASHVSVTGNYASNGSTQINVPYGYVHFGHGMYQIPDFVIDGGR